MLNKKFFNNLFVLDIANNHQGSFTHGKNIIEKHSKVLKQKNINAAFKFQFRDLDSLIHKNKINDKNNKHISRFLSTKLNLEDYRKLLNLIKMNKFLTMCTPFDEISVENICNLNFDIIKIASCSAKDFHLLEKVAESNKPVIYSTGGLEISDIDKLVSFSEHRAIDFSLMHCVSIYPTPT